VAGRINEDDLAQVRERAGIDEVVSTHVTLRRAGGGSFKGLCPFHDEKTPSFHVTPSRGFYHCLAGETEVLTRAGVRPIRDLAGGTHRVLSSHAVPHHGRPPPPGQGHLRHQRPPLVPPRRRRTREAPRGPDQGSQAG
jgi:CHC2 zinc finger